MQVDAIEQRAGATIIFLVFTPTFSGNFRMKSRHQRLLVWAILLSSLVSHAAVTPVRFYHLGEGDAGVGHNAVATNSIDSVSTNVLTLTGSPKYWDHAARGNTNSTFSVLFSTTNQATSAVVPETNNVCLEAWANTGWRNYHVIAYNGDSTNNGYGFILVTTNYLAVLGGIGTVATIPCPPGLWMHLALVCSNGTVAVFTNGTLAAVTNATPNLPTGNLHIGGPNASDPAALAVDIRDLDIKGFVDDVRISTFASGAFDVADLLYAPSPQTQLSITRNGDNVVISVPANKTLARLQSTTSLTSTNWQNVDVPEALALQNTWTNSLQGAAQFYRLNPSSGIVPVVLGSDEGNLPVPFGKGPTAIVNEEYPVYDEHCFFMGPLIVGKVVKCYDIDGTGLFAESPQSFDASTSVDPLTETTNTLTFHWQISQSVKWGGRYYTHLPDYHSPVFPIPVDSLESLQSDPNDPDASYWRMRLLMRHIPYTPGEPLQQNFCAFRFLYIGSPLSIPFSQTSACPDRDN